MTQPVWTGLALALLVVAALGRYKPRLSNLVLAVGVSALALYASFPLFGKQPFTTDAEVFRFLFSKFDVFADWNHPFLSYFLNKPAAMLSSEPWALRIVPFIFFILETLLLMVAVGRKAGAVTALLAGFWFICELPRRHGIIDLGDWDLAGAMLMAWVLFLQQVESRTVKDGPKWWVFWSAITFAGAFSSSLMIVPLVLFCLAAFMEWKAGRLSKFYLAGVAAVFAIAAVAAIRVFMMGQAEPGHAPRELGRFVSDMLFETPVGRTKVMAVPILLGIVWLVLQYRSVSAMFSLGSIVCVAAALLFSWRYSHVNGGYYLGLITPLLIYSAACGVAWAANALVGPFLKPKPGAEPSQAFETVLTAIVLAVVLIATSGFSRSYVIGRTAGAEYIKDFDVAIQGNDLPIVTNVSGLRILLVYERIRKGLHLNSINPLDEEVMEPIDKRIVINDLNLCDPVKGIPGIAGEFYLVSGNIDDSKYFGCFRKATSSCTELFRKRPERPATRDQLFQFFKCPPPAKMSRGDAENAK